MLQIALPVLLFAPERTPTHLTLKGGTNCDMAPQIDYIDMVSVDRWRQSIFINDHYFHS